MKKIAMIPALLGSQRIPDKNLILVDGYPMMFRVVEACKTSGIFDEIYINSEHLIFRDWAQMLGVKFYERPNSRGGSNCEMKNKSRQCNKDRCQTHDHFLYDFMTYLKEPVHLALIHTTSPLLKGVTIKKFMQTLEKENYDSLFSVEHKYTETLFAGKPLNFSFAEKIPTQTLPPIEMITWAMTGWKTDSFIKSYDRDDKKENGPTYCGKMGTYLLDRIEAIDVDNFEDLAMAEASLQYRRHKVVPGQFKVPEGFQGVESCLVDLIRRDGVTKFVNESANSRHSNLDEIKKMMGPPPWIYVLVYSATDQTGLICQKPGEGCRKHFHATHDEWWVVLEGQFEWVLGDGTKILTKKGDVVCIPKAMPHQITCVGTEPGIRMANGGRDMDHVYIK
ncbi:MAG: cytidylyltransferase domain-containing protein [Elusimicrobiota bacterium]